MVLLVFDPRQTWARLYDYDATGRQVGIALCAEHGDSVSVPAGWEIVDDRSPVPRLASVVAPADDAEQADPTSTVETGVGETGDRGAQTGTGEAGYRSAETGTGSPTLWSVDEPASLGDDTVDEIDEVDEVPEPDPVDDRDPGDDLDVDESTPLLSRAFRAAHVD